MFELDKTEGEGEMATTYRSRPAEVQAVQWSGANAGEIEEFAGSDFEPIDPAYPWVDDPAATAGLRDSRRGGTWQPLYTGDWVVRDAKGNLFPVRAGQFAETYEPVDGP